MFKKHHKSTIYVYFLLANSITYMFWILGLFIGTKQGYVMRNFDIYAIIVETGFIFIEQLFPTELEKTGWLAFLLPCLKTCFEGEYAYIIGWNAISEV